MKRLLLFLPMILLINAFSIAQENSLSIHYLNIGKGEYANWNSGIGIQSKISLKNNWLLLPDLGYISQNVKNIFYKDENNYHKRSDSYLFVNINAAYMFSIHENFKIIPFMGAGYYHDFERIRYKSSGSGQSWNPGQANDHSSAPFDVIQKHSTPKIMANIGVLTEVYVTRKIFLSAGYKYMIDIYDGEGFLPYLNAGIGYRF